MSGKSGSCFMKDDAGSCIVPRKEDMGIIFKRGKDPKSHYIHKYPAKLIPAIPRFFINNFTKPGDVVLDPFCGSGTTVLEANLAGRNGACTDVSPVSLLVSKVKTTRVPGGKLERARDSLLDGIRADKSSGVIAPKPAIPNIDFWFSQRAQDDLSIIKKNIDDIKDKDVRDFYRVSMSAITRDVSKARNYEITIRKDHEHVEKDVIAEFEKRVNKNIDAIKELEGTTSRTTVTRASASALPFVDGSIDAIVTDPPYSTWSIPYIDAMKHEMYWTGLTENSAPLKAENWGEESRTTCTRDDTTIPAIKKTYDMLAGTDRDYKKCSFMRFANNMHAAFKDFHRVLKPGGKFIIRVGNASTKINGQWNEIRNDEIFKEIGKDAGFSLQSSFEAGYSGGALPSTRNENAKSIRSEHFFIFEK